jgi:hypothetical protein
MSDAKTLCHCSACDAEGGLQANGQPKGRFFTARHYKTHVLRINRQNSARSAQSQQQPVGVEEAASAMFTSTLLDDGPDLETLPSKLWTSRAAFQEERAPYISPTAQTDPSSTSSIDVIIDGIHRLTMSPSPSVNDITNKLDNLTLPNGPPSTNDPNLSTKPVISGHRRPGMNKKDRSHRTVNDLAVLTSVQEELRNCSKALSTTTPSSSTIKDACATLAQARLSVDKIRRCTTETTPLKRQVTAQINNIDSRLIELDSLTPQVGPIEYPTGKLLITTRSRTVLNISFRTSFYGVHPSLRHHCASCNFPWGCLQRHHEC